MMHSLQMTPNRLLLKNCVGILIMIHTTSKVWSPMNDSSSQFSILKLKDFWGYFKTHRCFSQLFKPSFFWCGSLIFEPYKISSVWTSQCCGSTWRFGKHTNLHTQHPQHPIPCTKNTNLLRIWRRCEVSSIPQRLSVLIRTSSKFGWDGGDLYRMGMFYDWLLITTWNSVRNDSNKLFKSSYHDTWWISIGGFEQAANFGTLNNLGTETNSLNAHRTYTHEIKCGYQEKMP